MRLVLVLMSSVFLCSGATYYVDFASGNDANNGTSTGTAFKTIPGTRTANDSGFLNSAWGSFTTSARVPDNTTFKVKSGVTEDSTVGGYVWMSSGSGHFYNNGYTNLVFQVDPTWSSGTTIIDASGMTVGIAAVLIQIDGVTFQGFKIQNSTVEGLEAKEHQGTGFALTNITLLDLYLYNNGTSIASDAAGAGSGNIDIRYGYGITISNCVIDGNQQFLNGILLANTAKTVQSCNITSCIATNCKGTIAGNDCGIGFKMMNSQITLSNCVGASNLKGFDGGEQTGGGVNITYKLIGCTFSNNYWGCNFNSVGVGAYAGAVNFYLMNSIILSNQLSGAYSYAGPFNFYVVNNVFDMNGPGTAPTFGGGQLRIQPDVAADTNQIRAFVYNNVFRRAQAAPIYTGAFFTPTNNYTLTADYNSYQQNASEIFAMWSFSYGPQDVNFSYGVNGPGHASGNWYLQYGSDTTPPANGTGHFHCDPHSKGTSCDDTTLPPLDSNYMPTNHYAGLNLSGQSWFIPEMGLDRSGRNRILWDIGAFEFPPSVIINGATLSGFSKQ